MIKTARVLLFYLAVMGVVCLTSPFSTASHDPVSVTFRHILQSKMEAVGYINAIVQDDAGFMWFGGSNGLARYDGYQLKLYRYDEKKPRSLSQSYVYSLLVDTQGTLWVGTREGLNRYHPETDDFTVFHHPNPTKTALNADDIRCIFEDSRGHLWLGTRGGLYSFDRDSQAYHRYHISSPSNDNDLDSVVTSITEDQQGSLWVGNYNRGVSRFDLASNHFQHFNEVAPLSGNRIPNDIRRLYVDHNDVVWAATYSRGIFVLDRSTDSFEPFAHDTGNSEKSRNVWDFVEDKDGNMWIGDGSAVSVVPPNRNHSATTRFTHSAGDPSSPGNFVINRLYQDKAGDIWVGYFPSGIDLIDHQAAVFRNHNYDPDDDNTVADGGILSSFEDDEGNLWIGAGYGLNYFDRDSRRITRTLYDAKNPEGLSGNTVLSVLEDHKQSLWLGIWSGGLNRRDPDSNTFKHYLPEENNPNSLLGKEPWALLLDHQQRLWVGTESGVNRYNPETDSFTRYLPRQDQMDGDATLYTRAMLEDSQNRIWVGSIRGLFQLDPQTHRFTRHSTLSNNASAISNDYVIALYEDSQARIWVGTHGGGLNLFDPETEQFTHYTMEDGLPDDVVTGIVEDNNGILWLSSQQGLSYFNPATGTIRNYNKAHGLSGNLFNRNTPLRTHDGKIFFGNSRGFVLFEPDDLQPNAYQPPVVITDFKLFNQSVSRLDENSLLAKAIEYTDTVEIAHKQSMITFEFSALNFRSPELNHYTYWLEGFDQDWLPADTSRTATYTNLDSGHYKLHVKAANNDGIWSQEETTIELTVLPPVWRTWWAYCLYGLVFMAAIYGVIFVLVSRQSFSKERVLHKRLEEVDQLKDDFLANTSHKLRTPLSNMVGLSEAILNEPRTQYSEGTREKLNAIACSGKQLSGLVNEIIDYSQLADNKLQLHFQPVDVYALAELVISLVAPMAEPKPVRLINALSPRMPRVLADEARLEQILINLISNAIKYTAEGFVTISGEVQSSHIRISVEDSGIGIDPDQLEAIFFPFQRTEIVNEHYIEGTSLGLTVCRKLVELHNGKIEVRSALGSGSEFIFDLPIADDDLLKSNPATTADNSQRQQTRHRLGQSIAARSAIYPVASHKRIEQDIFTQVPTPANAAQYRILIVDDDSASRMVISAMLGAHNYQVVEAASGEEALALLAHQTEKDSFDLVILDVVMPHINGYHVCQKIRLDYPLKVLPILFLSASTRDKDIVTAYSVGGNDFLSKPAASAELISKVDVHLKLVSK
ncbi:hybrid sensor histidine kinase/response regulator [Teredinibacter purpureus]|uniref:hybrid sensor histidine kinase/response regulator n=1 Tax=Teredinibacter purpureus TaxID=2731756 RepID=UPI0009E436D9|nr:two-component regulator propeller domain-containing protein [Teredinibacter purpureus]